MNLNYLQKVRKYLNKLLDAQFIFPIETTQRLSLLVINTKEKQEIMNMCGLLKIEFTNQKNPFLLPFLDSVLDTVVGHEMYSFMDGYNEYNQVKMAQEDKVKHRLSFNGEHMPITLCHLDYATLQLPFKK
jgi:hypothetical protein